MFEQVVGTAVAYLDLDTSNFSTKFQSAWQQLQSFGDESLSTADKFQTFGNGLNSVGRQMTKSFTLPVAAAFTAATKKTMDFEESMTNVKSLLMSSSNDITGDMKKLEEAALDLGGSTKFTAKEVGDAFGYMALAGWDVDQMLAAIPGVLNLAAASGMDLAAASDAITDYLSAFNMEAKDATYMADMLAYAQANTNTTASQLVDAFGNTAVSANMMGQEMSTTTSLLSQLAQEGLKGSEAGTALSAVFRDMMQKSTTLADKEDILNATQEGLTSSTGNLNDLLGRTVIQIGKTLIPIDDSNGAFRDMYDIVKDVQNATSSLTEVEAENAMMMTFTSRSIKAMGILVNEGGDTVKDFTKQLENSNGTAEIMANTLLDNLAGSITLLSSAIDTFLIKVGDRLAPYIRSLAEWITKLTNKLLSLSDEEFDQVVKIAAIVAALGPCLSILGKLFTAIGSIIKVMNSLKGFKVVSKIGEIIKAIGTEGAAGSLLGKIGGIGMVIGGAITAVKNFFDMWKNGWSGLKTILEALGIALAAIGAVLLGAPALVAAIVGAAIFAVSQIVIVIHDHWDEIVDWWRNTVVPWFKQKIENFKQWLKDVGQAISDWWQSVKDKFNEWKQNISDWWNGLKQTVSEKLNEIWNNISKWATDAWNKVKAWFTNLSNNFSAWWENVKTMIGSKIQEIWNDIASKAQEIWNNITGFSETILNKLSEIWNNITTSITNFFTNIKNTLSNLFESLKTHIINLLESLKSKVETVMQTIKNAIDTVISVVKNVFETVSSFVSTVINAVKGIIESLINFVSNLAKSVLTTIQDLWDKVTSFVQDTFEKIGDKLKSLFEQLWNWIKEIPGKFVQLGKDIINSIWEGMKAIWQSVTNWFNENFGPLIDKAKDLWNATGGKVVNKVKSVVTGSHASGLDYVPYDGYVAELHRGERVLTNQENETYKEGRNSSSGDTYNFYNTKDDPYEYARQIRRTKKELAFGY